MSNESKTNTEDYYTWTDSFWYVLGYERELEITPDIKQVGKRHLLHKQIKYSDNMKLKKVSINEMSQSVIFETEIPVGKIIPLPRKPAMWSEIARAKKKKKNRFTVLDDTMDDIKTI